MRLDQPFDAQLIEGFVEDFLLADYEDPHPTPQFQRLWWAMFCLPDRNVMIAGPREHTKSTSLNHAWGMAAGLFEICPFQFKVSRTYELACEKLQQAKVTLTDNEKIKHVFGFRRFVKDTENDFIAEFTSGYQMRMYALGMEQKVRGKSWGTNRPNLILGDDMEDDEQVESMSRRDKAMKWFMRVLLPVGGRHTLNRVVGTILHQDSILMRITRLSDWKWRIDSACDETVSAESILWPQMFSQARLLKLKQSFIDAGDLAGFNMEYRNVARDATSGFFRPEDFPPIPEDCDRQRLTYYVGSDFAISTAERRDFTVFVVGGLDAAGFLNIVDVRRGRWDANEIIDEMFSVQQTWEPVEWFIEAGVLNRALGPIIDVRSREVNEGQGIFLNLTPLPSTTDKRTRARSFQARTRARAVRYDRDAVWFPDYQEELLQFDRGTHDDAVDASSILGRGLARMVTPLSVEDEDEEEREEAIREHLSLGRSQVTGY